MYNLTYDIIHKNYFVKTPINITEYTHILEPFSGQTIQFISWLCTG